MTGAAPLALLLASVLAEGGAAPAPDAVTRAASPQESAAPAAPTGAPDEEERSWSASASAYQYFVPEDADYVQPTLTFEERWLHLEARYNYEDLRTFSAWVGGKLSVEDEVTFELTPMIGAVLGDTAGLALGYRASLGFWKLDLSTEGEVLLDARDRSGNFFYSWSELTIAPLEWLRFGVSVQRTKAYETDIDIHRGLVLALSYGMFEVSGYVFDLGWDDPTFVVGASVTY